MEGLGLLLLARGGRVLGFFVALLGLLWLTEGGGGIEQFMGGFSTFYLG